MDVATAAEVLGVDVHATGDELRAAYRASLRSAHPDHGGSDAAVAAVVDAYRLLRDSPPALVPEPATVVVAGDTVVADLPAGDLFALLLDAADALGEPSYVDRAAGLLEVVVDVAGYGACSVMLTLQGRAMGVGGAGGAGTECWCTVEPLGGGPAPPVEVVTDLLADALRTVATQL